MGLAFDNSCSLWQTLPCSEVRGSCTFYDNTALSRNYTILLGSVKLISFAATLLAVILYRPPRIHTDQKNSITDGEKEGEGAEGRSPTTDVDGQTFINARTWTVGTKPETSPNDGWLNEGFLTDDGDGMTASHL